MPTYTHTHNVIADYSMKNCDAFLVLQDAYLNNQSSHLGKVVVDAILNTLRSDPANYFILESHHSLSMFVEMLLTKNDDVQVCVFCRMHDTIDTHYSSHLPPTSHSPLSLTPSLPLPIHPLPPTHIPSLSLTPHPSHFPLLSHLITHAHTHIHTHTHTHTHTHLYNMHAHSSPSPLALTAACKTC